MTKRRASRLGFTVLLTIFRHGAGFRGAQRDRGAWDRPEPQPSTRTPRNPGTAVGLLVGGDAQVGDCLHRVHSVLTLAG